MPPRPISRSRAIAAACPTAYAIIACLYPAQAQIAGQSAASPTQPPPARTTRHASENGLSTPRFVSLKADRVNVRRGPGHDHGIDWVFRRAGLPVEIIASSDIWRRVRDSEGATGWVLASLLSGRRTALVLPWDVKPGVPAPQVPLRADTRESANVIAQIEAGVLANVRWCDGVWCQIGIAELTGYVEQSRLWGVYKGEVIR